MTIAGNILHQISNPQVANVAGAMQQGIQSGQQLRMNQQRMSNLQQQASQSASQEDREQQRFTEIKDQNILTEIANDMNTALGMGPGAAQDKLLQGALRKAPEGSAPQIVLNDIISTVGPVKQTKLTEVNERAMQQGFLKPTAKATKTAEQLQTELEIRQQEANTNEGMLEVRRTKADKPKTTSVSPLKRLYDERAALDPRDPDYNDKRNSYNNAIIAKSGKKNAFAPEVIAENVKAVLNYDKDPDKLSKRGGLQAIVEAEVYRQNPGFSFVESSANAKYKQAQGNLLSRALIGGVQPLYDELRKKGDKLNNTRIKMFNGVKNWFKEQTGDADVVAFNNLRDDVVAETERILLGTGVLSDSKYLRAVDTLKTSNSIEQINAAIDQFEMVVAARLHALNDSAFEQHVNFEALKGARDRKPVKKDRRSTDNGSQEYGEGTEIENEAGEIFILKNGQWVPKGR